MRAVYDADVRRDPARVRDECDVFQQGSTQFGLPFRA
jgi:hypothetical protein